MRQRILFYQADDPAQLEQIRTETPGLRSALWSAESTVGRMRYDFSFPGPRIVWGQQRLVREPTFRAFVDKIMESASLTTPTDELATWDAALDAERGGAATTPR